jgi:SAM-dependent methyltransferase
MSTYEQRHAKRYALSLEALRPLLKPGMHVVELGARSTFADALQRELQVEVESSEDEDLRFLECYPPDLPLVVDAVLCMEVIEHIHDQEAKPYSTEWSGSGVAQMLKAALSALKPGGLLFLTTPNAASLNVLHKVLMQQPPMVYRPHVREYGPHELAYIVQAAGFERVTVTSHDSWNNDCMPPDAERRLREVIPALGYRADCRGENLFLTAFKPAST